MRNKQEIIRDMEGCIRRGPCGGCLYGKMEQAARERGIAEKEPPMCLDYLLRDALFALEALPESEASIVPWEELLFGAGRGWEETWLIGDDEDPERFDLEPCVWIAGHIMLESGSSADADSDHWREQYGRRYGMRVWRGSTEPTEEQRKAVKWE